MVWVYQFLHKTKIFERFYRAANVVKMETEGTGLGLYLAKAIVESSGGKMWFKKEGTTFWFSLPLRYEKESRRSFTNS
jgi:signal transduction histidine kinase